MVETWKTLRRLGDGVYGPLELRRDEVSGKLITAQHIVKVKVKRKDYLWLSQFPRLIGHHSHLVEIFDVHQGADGIRWELEYFRFGNLVDYIPNHCGLDESRAKSCITQLSSAIDYMHSLSLVHGDLCAENVLVCDPEMKVVKLSGFCHARKEGEITSKNTENIPYMPPEIVQKLPTEGFSAHRSQDSWSFGILLFCMLNGSFPWTEAEKESNKDYQRFYQWHKHHTIHLSCSWTRFSNKLLKLLRKLIHPKQSKRTSISNVKKYIKFTWTRTEDDIDLTEDFRSSGCTGEDGASGSSGSTTNLTAKLETLGVCTNGARQWRKVRTELWVSASSDTNYL